MADPVAPRKRSGWEDERGQVLAFVLPMLFTLVLFVAVTVNVGQAVNRRIALQVVADTGAYTGGTALATGMNHMAWWNRQLQRAYALAAHRMLGQSICAVSRAARANYNFIRPMVQVANAKWGNVPEERAREVTKYNAQDLFPGEDIEVLGYWDRVNRGFIRDFPGLGEYGSGLWWGLVGLDGVDEGTRPNIANDHVWQGEASGWIPSLWLVENFPDLILNLGFNPRSYQSSDTWACWTTCCLGPVCVACPVPYTLSVDPWYELARYDCCPYVFPWVVRAPATKALMFDNFFGPNAIPAMEAAAAAQPTGGDIKTGVTRYQNQMIPLYELTIGGVPLTAGVADSVYDRGWRWITH